MGPRKLRHFVLTEKEGTKGFFLVIETAALSSVVAVTIQISRALAEITRQPELPSHSERDNMVFHNTFSLSYLSWEHQMMMAISLRF